MGIIDRIKRRLPILGAPAAPAPIRTAPLSTGTVRPPSPPDEEEREEASPRGAKSAAEFIEETIKGNAVVLFLKGSPTSPQCGFSASAAGILTSYGKPYAHVNVLADPDIRDGVKQYSSWPTIPQIFIGGELVGGSDILRQLHESGELKELLAKAMPA